MGYSKVYDSISVVTLSEMFDLEKESVHAIVSQMVYKEELMASLDEPTQCMVMHRTEPSRLQSLALQLSDKITQLVENNERLLELRPGWQSNWKGRDGDKHGGDNRQGGYQNRGDNQGGRGGRGGGNFGRGNRGGGHFGGDKKGREDITDNKTTGPMVTGSNITQAQISPTQTLRFYSNE